MDIKSPAVGKVLRLSVERGAQVARGDELMVIESMKVEIPVKAPVSGTSLGFGMITGCSTERQLIFLCAKILRIFSENGEVGY